MLNGVISYSTAHRSVISNFAANKHVIFIINVHVLGYIFKRCNADAVFFGYPSFVMAVSITVENFFRFGIRRYFAFCSVCAVLYLFRNGLPVFMIRYGINVYFNIFDDYGNVTRSFFGGNGKPEITVKRCVLFFAVAYLVSYGYFVVRLRVFFGKGYVKSLCRAMLVSKAFADDRAFDITAISNVVSGQHEFDYKRISGGRSVFGGNGYGKFVFAFGKRARCGSDYIGRYLACESYDYTCVFVVYGYEICVFVVVIIYNVSVNLYFGDGVHAALFANDNYGISLVFFACRNSDFKSVFAHDEILLNARARYRCVCVYGYGGKRDFGYRIGYGILIRSVA